MSVPVHLQFLVNFWWQVEVQFDHERAECNNWCLLQGLTMDTHSRQMFSYSASKERNEFKNWLVGTYLVTCRNLLVLVQS